jgi:hypothetical protein
MVNRGTGEGMITAPFTQMDVEASDNGMWTDGRRCIKGEQRRVERATTAVCEGRASGGGVKKKKKKQARKQEQFGYHEQFSFVSMLKRALGCCQHTLELDAKPAAGCETCVCGVHLESLWDEERGNPEVRVLAADAQSNVTVAGSNPTTARSAPSRMQVSQDGSPESMVC